MALDQVELELLRLDIEHRLFLIEDILPGYRLTLMARYDGEKPLDDADIMLTVDDPRKALAALDRSVRAMEDQRLRKLHLQAIVDELEPGSDRVNQ